MHAGVGLSREAHEIPPTSAYSRFFLPAQQTWQKHFAFYLSGLWKTNVLIWEQVSKDFCRGCEHGSHGQACPKAHIWEGILRLEALHGLSRAEWFKPVWLIHINDKTRLGDLISRQQEELMGRPAVKNTFIHTTHKNGPKMLLQDEVLYHMSWSEKICRIITRYHFSNSSGNSCYNIHWSPWEKAYCFKHALQQTGKLC